MDLQKFDIIGISVRTTNENGQCSIDIGALWQRFFAEDVMAKIPNKLSSEIFSVYTDYEKDHTKPYTVILGCKVKDLETIPAGMVGRKIGSGKFVKFVAKGNLMQGVVYNEWQKIWKAEAELNRTYHADFEVYGQRAANRESAEVDIFISVKS